MASLILLLIPLVGALAILFGSPARLTATAASGAALLLGLLTLFTSAAEFWSISLPVLPLAGINLSLDLIDGMSVVLVALTVIVLFAAVLSGQSPRGSEKLYYSSSLLIAAGALGAFLSRDVFFFYAFHELALIPTFLMIGILGRGDRKANAWRITIYLAVGSIVLLAGLLWLVAATGGSFAMSDIALNAPGISPDSQIGIAALLLLGFGTLVSLFPLHSWAAPAYASAPVPTAMLHAGVLKKFGLYGILRLAVPLVPEGLAHWNTVLIVLLLGNILWVGYVTVNQRRMDLMLGNSSVMHMGYIFLAITALIAAPENTVALKAAVVLMFAHGVSIALLFALTDRLERSTGTLELSQMGGLAKKAPAFAFLFGLAAMASIGLPGLANFAGEVMVFIAGFQQYDPAVGFGPVQIGTILALWGVVLSALYMLRAFKNTFQGPLVPSTEGATDITALERIPYYLLAASLLIVGLYPDLLIALLPG